MSPALPAARWRRGVGLQPGRRGQLGLHRQGHGRGQAGHHRSAADRQPVPRERAHRGAQGRGHQDRGRPEGQAGGTGRARIGHADQRPHDPGGLRHQGVRHQARVHQAERGRRQAEGRLDRRFLLHRRLAGWRHRRAGLVGRRHRADRHRRPAGRHGPQARWLFFSRPDCRRHLQGYCCGQDLVGGCAVGDQRQGRCHHGLRDHQGAVCRGGAKGDGRRPCQGQVHHPGKRGQGCRHPAASRRREVLQGSGFVEAGRGVAGLAGTGAH